MGRYTELTLYLEEWGGYPDREASFGLPNLAWFVATADRAARCRVTSEIKGPTKVDRSAQWQQIPRELIDPVPGLLDEAGAFGDPAPLVEDTGPGDYLLVWELTGVVHDRPFHLAVQVMAPGSQWTPLGQRLSDSIMSLRDYQPDKDLRQ